MSSANLSIKENGAMVVFGASGDLSKKKTFPALFSLFSEGRLPKDIRIVGYARSKIEHEDFLDRITQNIKIDEEDSQAKEKLEEFKKRCSYYRGSYDKPEDFEGLNSHLCEREGDRSTHNRIFYLALPPDVFVSVATNLKKKCVPEKGIARLVIEKPFGVDLKSAQELQSQLAPLFDEKEIYRIDHYLGKEMVQNLVHLRFCNPVISHLWDKNSISSVQITFKEPIGTEGRGGYFDSSTIVRDIVQNHLVQILTLLTMETPTTFSADDLRDEKVKVLRRTRLGDLKDIVLGQYVKSKDGKKPGYLDDETVPKGSRCPTYSAIPCFIDTERWRGVPFLLKAGKAMDIGKVEIRVQFKAAANGLFKDAYHNELVIRVQPDEAIYFKMNIKQPGLSEAPLLTDLDLTYSRRFKNMKLHEAYEALFLDAFAGDQSRFARIDELECAWSLVDPLLKYMEEEKPVPEPYEYGSDGPECLYSFLKKFGYIYDSPDYYDYPVMSVPSDH
ncbi:glucose-6-phosphate 1-dehydrogenase Zwf1 [Schizosaccharomyces pombe]|uniref:Glucose-6-phosphate 1-dehydrogenase n=1 Tax=Schizosaccharomyces pombe (strain 972 / ATCC 24843) TaxID=284812 RepID=G6PD_SCHPO|nr:putative glucose-6-phosphate 1-dehydrogenase [Schizosaccharomyces pombe]O00091.2 RecName: Full=Glucose-6-phosphate 1-dehydrogenase; Short=G6PD [Schizosaccharomyces pombe 972h-]CAB08746.2 glucose-6-phosphate 1-dehydrogenase (predicted) [Schizosaccharomyces pombe]|eukprot:NP_593344.2 putative glucose-6-phosphate 1-dehydrogenase [Schizosaccharomyces pombe]